MYRSVHCIFLRDSIAKKPERERAVWQYVQWKPQSIQFFRTINEGINTIEWLTLVQLRILEEESACCQGKHCYEGWGEDEKAT